AGSPTAARTRGPSTPRDRWPSGPDPCTPRPRGSPVPRTAAPCATPHPCSRERCDRLRRGAARDAGAAIPAPLRREEDRAVAPPSVTPAPEGMLEAQIQQDRVVTRAGAHADRERDPRHDLQPARKIAGPADPGTDRQ